MATQTLTNLLIRGTKGKIILGLVILALVFLFMAVLVISSTFMFLFSSPKDQISTDANMPVSGVPYAEFINQAAQQYKIEAPLLAAIIRQESNFKPRARSPVGAIGLTQQMPANCREAGLDPATTCWDPQKNILAGAREISGYIKRYHGDLRLALAAYNAGPANVARFGNNIPPFVETQQYVQNVLSYYESYKSVFAVGNVTPGKLIFPCSFTHNITSRFGMRLNPVKHVWRLHDGVDIAAPGIQGQPALAAGSGVVTRVGYDAGGYGNFVTIDHGRGLETLYGHLQAAAVRQGQQVQAGQVIGYIGNTGGSTGPHLHFRVHVKDKPVDPLKFVTP